MKPDDHAVYRRLLHDAISPAAVADAEPFARSACRDGVARIAARPGTELRPVLDRTVLATLLPLLFGLDPDGADAERARVLLLRLPVANVLLRRRRAKRALDGLCELVRRRGTAPSVLASLGPGADDTTVANLILMLRTGGGDLASLLHWVLYEAATNRGWLERVDADPDLARRIVLETLRLEQSEWILRRADADLDLDGFRVPPGWMLRLCVRESHRDPEVFADPERFDADRFLGRPDRSACAPFGNSRVTCLGDRLTVTVARIFVEELARYDVSVLAPGRRAFRRMHWAPGPGFRVALEPRAVRTGAARRAAAPGAPAAARGSSAGGSSAAPS